MYLLDSLIINSIYFLLSFHFLKVKKSTTFPPPIVIKGEYCLINPPVPVEFGEGNVPISPIDGDDDYITTNNILGGENNFTVAMQVKRNGDGDTDDNEFIWNNHYSHYTGLDFEGGKIRGFVKNSSNVYFNVETEMLENDVWYEIVFVVSQENDFIRLYLNGEEVAEENLNGEFQTNSINAL